MRNLSVVTKTTVWDEVCSPVNQKFVSLSESIEKSRQVTNGHNLHKCENAGGMKGNKKGEGVFFQSHILHQEFILELNPGRFSLFNTPITI